MTVKFSKADINAIANSRYFKKTGMKLIVVMIAIMAVMYVFITWIPVVPSYIFYIVMGVSVFGLIVLYDRGQRKLFKRYWKRLEEEGYITKDELEEDSDGSLK